MKQKKLFKKCKEGRKPDLLIQVFSDKNNSKLIATNSKTGKQ